MLPARPFLAEGERLLFLLVSNKPILAKKEEKLPSPSLIIDFRISKEAEEEAFCSAPKIICVKVA